MLVYSPNGLGSKSKPCHLFKPRITSKCLGLIAKTTVRGNDTERKGHSLALHNTDSPGACKPL